MALLFNIAAVKRFVFLNSDKVSVEILGNSAGVQRGKSACSDATDIHYKGTGGARGLNKLQVCTEWP